MGSKMTHPDIVATAKKWLSDNMEISWTTSEVNNYLSETRNLAAALLVAIEYLELIADRMPSCSCMDTPNLAREALAKMGMK